MLREGGGEGQTGRRGGTQRHGETERERQRWKEGERHKWRHEGGETVRQGGHTLVLFLLEMFRFWVNWCKIGC